MNGFVCEHGVNVGFELCSHCDALQKILSSDKEYIIGIDEVGYGCLAGPVYVCAFVAPKEWAIPGIDDSKKLSEKQREEVFPNLKGLSKTSYCITVVHPNTIDEYKSYGDNMHGALKYLYWKATQNIIASSEFNNSLIVLDGIIKFPEQPYKLADSISLPKADGLIPQVMAASIIAKVSRDTYMKDLANKYPNYGWEKNKGYGTPDHLAALKKYGYCDEHRRMYEPIKSMINV